MIEVERSGFSRRLHASKALVYEQFGDGIISAINFKLDIKKVEDPNEGPPRDQLVWQVSAYRAFLTLV